MDHVTHALDATVASPIARAAARILGVDHEPVLWALNNLGQGKYVQKTNFHQCHNFVSMTVEFPRFLQQDRVNNWYLYNFFLLQCVQPAAQQMSHGRALSRSCCSVSARGGGAIWTSCRSSSRSNTITSEIQPLESSQRATLLRCSSSQDAPRDTLPSSTRCSWHLWQPMSFRQMGKLQPSKRYLFLKIQVQRLLSINHVCFCCHPQGNTGGNGPREESPGDGFSKDDTGIPADLPRKVWNTSQEVWL